MKNLYTARYEPVLQRKRPIEIDEVNLGTLTFNSRSIGRGEFL